MIDEEESRLNRSWIAKFRCAFRGAKLGVRGQSSFFIHFFMAAAVIAAGVVLNVTTEEWYILILCIAGVLTAEMFNSAIESLARAITHEENPHVGGALDIGSAAVLMASLGAVLIGSVIFGRRLLEMLGW
jgi:diacylglycerol kinase